MTPSPARLLLAVVLLALTSGCFTASYLVQAGDGEAAMLLSARPLLTTMRDPRTPPRVRRLLFHLPDIKAFGQEQGLKPTRNYERYSDLHREAAVWVVEACPPLSFDSKRWSFPIVGSVPYLGFFDRAAAQHYGDALAASEGLDVEVRSASAYSTLGWFRDPVLSPMLVDNDEAEGDLANTVLHESVHATVYVPNQSAFDESLASYVANHLTPKWLERLHGAHANAAKGWLEQQASYRERVARLHRAHEELAGLYASTEPAADKLRKKSELLGALQKELGLKHQLNNAGLAGYQTYDTGGAAFDRLFDACGRSFPRFLKAIERVRAADFEQPQQDDFSPVIDRLTSRGCPAPTLASSPRPPA